MIGFLLIIQMAHASDHRIVTVFLRPIDRFSLGSEGAEHMVGMVFDDIVVDRATLASAFGARLNVNVCHSLLPSRGWIQDLLLRGTYRRCIVASTTGSPLQWLGPPTQLPRPQLHHDADVVAAVEKPVFARVAAKRGR
ncbi:MAG: hypothetical protein M3O36_03320 [Myxococcota bacterium]|nr:hypothetical protein [Myxococcota bacterium]